MLIIAFILLPILYVAGYYIWQALQLNNYKSAIEKQLTKAIGNQITIQGPINMSASLSPVITIQNIVIANPAWSSTKNAATIQKLTLQISFKKILKGKIIIPKIIVYEPQILLEKNKQGQYNWDFDLLAKFLDQLPGFLKPLKLNIVTEQGKLVIKQAGGLSHDIEILHANIKIDDARKVINIAASTIVKIIPVKFISQIDYNGKITKGPYHIKAKVNGIDVEFEI
jgi:uncharacterized protein involved in outer membrane biogenesis